MEKRSRGGFTLAELLVVVAIIGVLVAISIPIFTTQIHKARVATDWANVISYYSQLQYDFIRTGSINSDYMHQLGQNGLTSFELGGQINVLKEGYLWVTQNDKKNQAGYNVLYECKKYDPKCELVLCQTQ